MGRTAAEKLDLAAELCGALALGLGTGSSAWLAVSGAMPARGFSIAASAAIGAVLGWLSVRSAGGKAKPNRLPDFEVTVVALEPHAETAEPDDMLNTEGILLLDQPLREENSRVVSLFGGEAIATAGELQQRIAAHLSGKPMVLTSPQAVPDASQALHEALADLRRSLRRG